MIHSLAIGAGTIVSLMRDQRLSSADLEMQQIVRLRDLVRAASTAPHYRDVLAEAALSPEDLKSTADFARLPPLTKERVREAPHRLYTSTATFRPPRATVRVSTTGSTGVPLTYELARDEAIREFLHIAYGFYASGACLADMYVTLEVPSVSGRATVARRWRPLRAVSIDLRAGTEEMVRLLDLYTPDVIYTFPSVLQLLASEVLSKRPLRFRPKLLVTHGEILTRGVRDLVQRSFKAPVRDTYGSRECFRIAFECDAGRYHVLPTAAYVEVDASTLGSDGSAELLVTNLNRFNMPLIRYRLGDRGIIARDPCPCGCRFPSLLHIVGRSDDFIRLPSGRRISARAVNVLEEIEGLLEYQIVQKTPAVFVVRIRADERFGESSLRRIQEIIRTGCSPDEIDVACERVAHIPRSPNGKLRAVISNVDNG